MPLTFVSRIPRRDRSCPVAEVTLVCVFVSRKGLPFLAQILMASSRLMTDIEAPVSIKAGVDRPSLFPRSNVIEGRPSTPWSSFPGAVRGGLSLLWEDFWGLHLSWPNNLSGVGNPFSCAPSCGRSNRSWHLGVLVFPLGVSVPGSRLFVVLVFQGLRSWAGLPDFPAVPSLGLSFPGLPWTHGL